MTPAIPKLPAGARILAAVSGGADSVFLVHRLIQLYTPNGHDIAISHINHGTRGVSSDADEAFVQSFAEKLDIPSYTQRIDLDLVNLEGNKKNESNLRALRLGLLKSLAQSLGYSVIAFGHHRDDLAETFLINALRGSGPAGLEAMRPLRPIPGTNLLALRPLLTMRRSEIEKALRDKDQNWRTDESNADLSYRRNALRLDILPALEKIEPGAIDNIATSSELCGEILSVYTATCEQIASVSTIAVSDTAVLLDLEIVRQSPFSAEAAPGIVRHAISSLASTLQGTTPLLPNRENLRAIVRRIHSPEEHAADFSLVGGIRLYLTNQWMLVYTEAESVLSAFLSIAPRLPFLLLRSAEPIPVTTEAVVAGRTLSKRPSDRPFPETMHQAGFAASIDMAKLSSPLTIRCVEKNETIRLVGGGTKSVGEALQEKHVPTPLRDHIGALCHGEEVLWIPGIRRSAVAVAELQSTTELHFALE